MMNLEGETPLSGSAHCFAGLQDFAEFAGGAAGFAQESPTFCNVYTDLWLRMQAARPPAVRLF